MSDVLPPREEVIAVVPLEDPGLMVEAPVAPHVEHHIRIRRATALNEAGAPANYNVWQEQDRNNVLHHVCGQLDRTADRLNTRITDLDSKGAKTLIALLGGVGILLLTLALILGTHRETIDNTAKRLEAAEKKIKVLLATSAEKEPTFATTSNGNVIAEKPE